MSAGAAAAPAALPAAPWWRLWLAALSALLLLWLPPGLLQLLDALLVYTAPSALLADLALLMPLVALAAAGLASLAWAGGGLWQTLRRGRADLTRLRWALLLGPLAWLCLWQLARTTRLWLQLTLGWSFTAGAHTRLIGVALLAGALVLAWRLGGQRLALRLIALLRALRAPALALLVAGCAFTLWQPPVSRQTPPPPTQAAPAGAPDVLVISLDAVSALDANACGNGPSFMPRLRAFAQQQATCFSQLYAGANFTVPTTSTLESGQLPWAHLATQIGSKMAAGTGRATLASQLQAAGWRTLSLTENVLASPLQRGSWRAYDEVALVPALLKDRLRRLLLRWPDSTLPLLVDGLVAFIGAGDTYWHGRDNPYDADRLYPQLLQWLAAAPAQQPSLAWVHTMPPHAPYLPPASTRYKLLPPGELERWGDQAEENLPYPPSAQARVDKHRLRYRESLLGADEALGRLLDELQRSGRLARTVLVITSDHGESFERGFMGHAGPLLHEPVIRIPLVIRLPGQATGRQVDQPVSQADLAPTLLALAGAAPLPAAAGRSLVPLLQGQPLPPVPVFSMSMERQSRFVPIREGHYAVIDGPWKLVWHRAEQRGELYHLAQDPAEQTDLAAREPQQLARLRALVEQQLARAEQRRAQAMGAAGR